MVKETNKTLDKINQLEPSPLSPLTLSERQKKLEKLSDRVIPNSDSFAIRMDGAGFSKFTRGLKKPFDEILSKVFELTCIDLMKKFNPSVIYTQSDEITMIFPSRLDENAIFAHEYSGRHSKILSKSSSYCTKKFNKHFFKLAKDFIDSNEDSKYTKVLEARMFEADFDSRLMITKDRNELVNSVISRYRDAIKNSKSMYSIAYLSHKELLNLNGDEKVKKTLKETGNDWNKIDERYKSGIFFKRTKRLKTVEHNGENFEVIRTVIDVITKNTMTYKDKDFILSKEI